MNKRMNWIVSVGLSCVLATTAGCASGVPNEVDGAKSNSQGHSATQLESDRTGAPPRVNGRDTVIGARQRAADPHRKGISLIPIEPEDIVNTEISSKAKANPEVTETDAKGSRPSGSEESSAAAGHRSQSLRVPMARQTPAGRQTAAETEKKATSTKEANRADARSSAKAVSPIDVSVPRDDIRGVYVSAYALQGRKWDRIQRLLDTKQINALVIDVKNDAGRFTYPSQLPAVKRIRADRGAKMKDMSALLQRLKQQDVYTIARIVTFKDPFLAAAKPEWAIRSKNGGVWRDRHGVSWVDPHREEVWDYAIDAAKEAIRLGFDEVQFDYVRFPDYAGLDRETNMANVRGETKDQVIQRFLRRATREIHETGGWVSADVFGLTTTVKNGMGIGQKWELLAPEVDTISPMIYPSHYSKGSYGVRAPDLHPYTVVREAVKDANARNVSLRQSVGHAPKVRPWLQDFTAKWVEPHQTYDAKDVQEQIKALKEQGIRQYLLWNPSCDYSLSRS